MGKKKLQQILPIFLFNEIIRVEREDDLHKEVEDINENVKQKTPMPKKGEKRPIRHPNFFVATLQFEKQIKHEKGEKEVANK